MHNSTVGTPYAELRGSCWPDPAATATASAKYRRRVLLVCLCFRLMQRRPQMNAAHVKRICALRHRHLPRVVKVKVRNIKQSASTVTAVLIIKSTAVLIKHTSIVYYHIHLSSKSFLCLPVRWRCVCSATVYLVPHQEPQSTCS